MLKNSERLSSKVLGVNINVLLDTGTSYGIIGYKFFNKVPKLRCELMKMEQPINAKAVNGSTISYPAKIEFDMEIESMIYHVRLLFINNEVRDGNWL